MECSGSRGYIALESPLQEQIRIPISGIVQASSSYLSLTTSSSQCADISHKHEYQHCPTMNDPNHSRPTTPLSPLTSSLYHATSTIDDLIAALANFSRVPSPEPFESITCCCGREDCENLKTWLELKARLGSRLILSAGSACCYFPKNFDLMLLQKWDKPSSRDTPRMCGRVRYV